ncbi:MAG TPA: hypothetical protein V6D22_14015 [Candidatus Obscuribacterales bacterium]
MGTAGENSSINPRPEQKAAPARTDSPDHAQTQKPAPSDSNCLVDFYKSATTAAIGDPLRGIAQIADSGLNLVGIHADLDGKIKSGLSTVGIEKPKDAAFGTSNWYMQQLGSAAGMMVPFMGARLGIGRVVGSALGEESSLLKAFDESKTFGGGTLNWAGREATLSAASGFTYGTLLRPSDEQNVGTLNFVSDRLHQGTNDGATFGLMGFANPFMSKAVGAAATIIEKPLATERLISRLALAQKVAALAMRNPISSGALSGLPGGFINAEMGARQRGRWLPTGEELKENLIGMSFIGGAFGGAHWLVTPPVVPKANAKNLESQTTQRTEAQTTAPQTTLVAERGRLARDDAQQESASAAKQLTDQQQVAIRALFGDNFAKAANSEYVDLFEQAYTRLGQRKVDQVRALGDWYTKYVVDRDHPEGTITSEGIRRVARHWFDLEQPIRDLPLGKFIEQVGILERDMPKKQYGGFSGGGENVTPRSAYAAINMGRGELTRGELITLEKAIDGQALRKRGDRLKTLDAFQHDIPTMDELKRAIKTFEIDPLIPLELAKQDLKPWERAALSRATKDYFNYLNHDAPDRDGDPRIIAAGIGQRFTELSEAGRRQILEWNTNPLVAAQEMHPHLSDFHQHFVAAAASRHGDGAVDVVRKMNGQHFIELFTPFDRGESEEHPLLSYAQENYDQHIPIVQWFDKNIQATSWPAMDMAMKLSSIFKDAPSDVVHSWLKSRQIEQYNKEVENFPIGFSLSQEHTNTLLNRALEFPSGSDRPRVAEWLLNNPSRADETKVTIADTTSEYLRLGRLSGLEALHDLGLITDGDLQNQIVRQSARAGLRSLLSDTIIAASSQDRVQRAADLFGGEAQTDIIRPALVEALRHHLSRGVVGQAKEILKFNMLTDDDLRSGEVSRGAIVGLVNALSNGSVDAANSILDFKILNEQQLTSAAIKGAAYDGLLNCLANGNTFDAIKIQRLGLLGDVDMSAKDIHAAAYKGVIEQLSVGNITAVQNLVDLKALNKDEVDKALRETADAGKMTIAMRAALQQKIKFDTAVKRYLDIDKLDDPAAEKLLERLHLLDGNWQDEDNVRKPFESGAAVFGAARMVRYALNAKVSPHDALHGFDDVVNLYQRTGVSKDKFYNNILKQVGIDDAVDDTGSSYARLNVIARTFPHDISTVLDKAKEYPDIKTLQDLASAFSDSQSVVSSWPHLQRFAKLQQFVEQVELLPQLQQLRQEGKTKLADWVEALAFHPDSRVSTQAILDFWKNPEKFIDYNDAHSGRSHELKKPSNYTDIPHLDMTPTELRDALVNGVLDRLQVFTPMKVEYQVGGNDTSVGAELSRALGSQRKGIRGEAKSPTKLFAELNAALKPAGLNVAKVVAGAEVPADVRTQVDKLLYDPIIGADRPDVGLKLVAEIHRKSDPLAVVAGDDTVSCMGFGTGKNNIYMFNPNDALFTVRLVRGDGTSRTIAQSVLTKDKDIKIPFPQVLQKFRDDEKTSLHSVIPEDALRREQAIIAADNVEVHPNYRQGDHPPALEAVYRDFFGRYIKEHGQDENLRGDKIIIGLGYSDALNQLPKEPNTFVPQAPVGYSDKTHDEVLALSLSAPQKLAVRVSNAQNANVENRIAPQGANKTGISPLTFEDTLPVAYLEGKAFADNSSLRVGLHNLENALIAKDINNAARGRSNLSLKYVDSDGKIKGYLLAYEGEGYDGEKRQPMIFVSDLSSDRAMRDDGTAKPTRVGGKLMYEFADLYKQNYLDQGKMMPIFMNAREQTSYKLIMEHLQLLGKRLGYEFEVKDLGEHLDGDSTMHDIVLVPVRKP